MLGLGAAVALLSSTLPYAFELIALRRLPAAAFAILMSLALAVAALAGWGCSDSTRVAGDRGNRPGDRGIHRRRAPPGAVFALPWSHRLRRRLPCVGSPAGGDQPTFG
jgi:hypothetical protein